LVGGALTDRLRGDPSVEHRPLTRDQDSSSGGRQLLWLLGLLLLDLFLRQQMSIKRTLIPFKTRLIRSRASPKRAIPLPTSRAAGSSTLSRWRGLTRAGTGVEPVTRRSATRDGTDRSPTETTGLPRVPERRLRAMLRQRWRVQPPILPKGRAGICDSACLTPALTIRGRPHFLPHNGRGWSGNVSDSQPSPSLRSAGPSLNCRQEPALVLWMWRTCHGEVLSCEA
jgi:hypothetical protein